MFVLKIIFIIIQTLLFQNSENKEFVKVETPKGTIYAYRLHHNEEDVYVIKNFEYGNRLKLHIDKGYCVLGKTVRGYTEAIIFPIEKTEFEVGKFKGNVLFAYLRFPPDWFEDNLKNKIERFEGTEKKDILERGIEVSNKYLKDFFHYGEYVFWIDNLTAGSITIEPDSQIFYIGMIENRIYSKEIYPFKRRKGGKTYPYFEKMWNLYEIDNLKVYYPDNSVIKDSIEKWAIKREKAFESICNFLKVDWKYGKIKIFVFNDNKQAKMYALPTLGFSNPDDNSVFTRAEQTPGHEIAHVVSAKINNGNRINSALINEGLSTLLDYSGRNYHRISRYLLYEKKIECDILGESFRKCPFGYWLGASFVKFLIDKYGLKKFKKFFAQEEYDEEKAFENFYNKKGKELIKEWKEFLKNNDFGELSQKEKSAIKKLEGILNE